MSLFCHRIKNLPVFLSFSAFALKKKHQRPGLKLDCSNINLSVNLDWNQILNYSWLAIFLKVSFSEKKTLLAGFTGKDFSASRWNF